MPDTSNATTRSRDNVNVSRPERWASSVAGGALIAYGLRKRSFSGMSLAALGGVLAYRGLTGHCDFYEAAGIHTGRERRWRNTAMPRVFSIRVSEAIAINQPRTDVYRFWRNLENLPRFMRHLVSVKEIDNKHSHWVAKAPGRGTVEWKAEIINDVENELIAWRWLSGDVRNAGSVHFLPTADGLGTELRVELQYNPPGGVIGFWLAKLLGEEPSRQIAEDLRRMKKLLETCGVTAAWGEQASDRGAEAPPRKGWVRDVVGDASEESFPASDPPSWTPEALPH